MNLMTIDAAPDTVLIVEDSNAFTSLLTKNIQKQLGIDPVVFITLKETRAYLEAHAARHHIIAALLGFSLPDAPSGEVVDYMLSKKIPTIVFTEVLSDDTRKMLWSKPIVDYVSKDNVHCVDQAVSIVKRLKKNLGMKVLVADDSKVSRKLFSDLLKTWNFTVIEAEDGQQAMEILSSQDDIRMLITDCHMPGMDGIELVKALRVTRSKSRLPIIGMSSEGGGTTSAYFLKAGANDYIHKPFLPEELYCRVIHNLENSEYIAVIRDMAENDFLTGIYNRRSFFNYAEKLFAGMKRGNHSLTIAMLDIDHFKKCNDIYGHDAGDAVIQFIATSIAERFRKGDVVARIGGEEFCVACVNMNPDHVMEIFDTFRQEIESSVIEFQDKIIRVTISIGVCPFAMDSLEEMVKVADNMLYQAKNTGRNKVCVAC